MSPTEGVEGLDPVKLSMINANMDVNLTSIAEYREKATNLFLKLYNGAAKSFLSIDNTLQLSSELIGHVDGSLVELARSRLLTLFKDRASCKLLSS